VHTGIWWVKLKRRVDWEEAGVDRRIILIWIFRKWDEAGAWTGLIWLRIGTGGGHL